MLYRTTIHTMKPRSMTSKQQTSTAYRSSWSVGLVLAHAVMAALSYECVRAALAFDNKESALAFYGVYHREPLNQLIHFIGVPGILWSLLVMQSHLTLTDSIRIRLPFTPTHPLTWALLWWLFFLGFYVSIDVWGALLYSPFLYAAYASAVRWHAADQAAATKKMDHAPWYGTGHLLRNMLILHCLSWYVQIHPGHGIIEGATPASVISLGGALTTAPLFAFYEGVWYLGLRKELQQHVLELVDEYTVRLCAQGAAMRACEALQ